MLRGRLEKGSCGKGVLAVAAEGLLGMGGEEQSARGLATRSPSIVWGCRAFSLQQISPRQLRGLSGDSVSSRGSPEGWQLSPRAWGHGRACYGVRLLRGPKEVEQGDAARAGWGLCGVGRGSVQLIPR